MVVKLNLDCDEALWKEISLYQLKENLHTKNEAVLALIRKGLKK